MSERVFGYAGDRPVAAPVGGASRACLRVVGELEATYDDRPTDRHPADHRDVGSHGRRTAVGEGPVDPQVALQRLREAVDLVARADLDGLGDRALLEHTVALDVQTTRLEARRLAALARVDEVAAFTADACVTAGSWFAMRTRRDPNHGARYGRWTRRLAHFGQLREAFETGQVTFEHVLVVLRAARGTRRTAALVDHEHTLVTLARRGQPRDLEAAVHAICDAVDHRDPHDSDCAPSQARRLYHAATIDGLGDLRGLLDPTTAQRLDNLLHAYTEPDPPDTDEADRRTPAQARHDAFDAILQAAEQHPDIPSVQGAKPHLIVYADIFTLLGHHHLASRPTTRLGSGRPVDLQHIIHLLQDARCSAVLGLGPFRPVAFGRTRRTIPGWLRGVLAMTHGHCRGPGCDRPIAWTDAMHLDQDWADGGTTELDTTIPGCRKHHQLRDIIGWNVNLNPNTATTTWTSPDRRTVLVTHPPDP